MEYVKGISLKFLEIDRFLGENPLYQQTAVFVLVGVTPPVQDTSYRVYEGETRSSAAYLNRKYGRQVVYYEERGAQHMELRDRLAYFAAVDVLLMTPLV